MLRSIEQHPVPIMAFMSVCLISTFIYLIAAFRTANLRRAYPAPLAAVGFFAIHDASYILHWNR